MRKLWWVFVILVAILAGFFGAIALHAQTGNVVWFTSTAGTTKALNCPAAPAGPSVCLVGDGFWVWQSSASGWFLASPPSAAAPVALTINGLQKTLPASFTLSTSAATISAPTASAPAITAQ